MNHQDSNPDPLIVEEVDIEDYIKRDLPIPEAKRYVIRIDKDRKVLHKATVTGREILALVDKTPEDYKLYEHKRGQQPVQIGPDQVIHLREHRVERFTTMPKGTTEGCAVATLRRQFRLPSDDEDYLDRLGLPWETIIHADMQWLLIQEWTVPPGYNDATVAMALLIPPNYSDSQIDMVYFRPALFRSDRRQIGALSTRTISGGEWQQWSRHRTSVHPWRPGVDNIASHLGLVDEWLRREFEKP